MTIPQITLIFITAIPLLLVSLDRLRIDVAALLIVAALGIAQFLGMGILAGANEPDQALKSISGFSQPVIITLLSLFIFTSSLEKSGITRWIARKLMKLGGSSEWQLITLFASTTAVLSLVMNNLAAGALVLPSAMEVSRRTRIKPSKLLIPVAYGSLLGGAATYFTTANIIISNLLVSASPPQPPLHILAFFPTGGLIAVTGILFMGLFGRKLLPDREPAPEQMMARFTGSELEEFYGLGERLWEVQVPADSVLANKSLALSGLGERYNLAVAGLWHRHQANFAPSPDQMIHPDDILLVVGREDRVTALTEAGVQIGRGNSSEHISERGVSFFEVMPSPHSQALGHTLRELEFRNKFGLTALALFRGGRSFRTDVGNMPLVLGDSLLLIGSPRHLKPIQNNPDYIVLEPDLSDQPVQRKQVILTTFILSAAIYASIVGMPVYLAMLSGAVLLALFNILDMEEAYRSINWQVILVIAGMYSISLAMVNTGLSQWVGDHLLNFLRPSGPLGLALGAFLLSALFTQLMGGQVTALVTGPITISAALSMHADPHAVAVATAIGCSAAFLTPIAHPVNILTIAPANYRFRDFFHIGWKLTLVSFITLLIGMIWFWDL